MFVIHMVENDRLMVGRLEGILDAGTTEGIVEFIEIKEAQVETGFNRFCDLSRMESIQLSCEDIHQLAGRRREHNPNDIKVKSAILATNPLAFGIARMYEQLLNSPRIEVRVFDDLQGAAAWLGVPRNCLTA